MGWGGITHSEVDVCDNDEEQEYEVVKEGGKQGHGGIEGRLVPMMEEVIAE